MTVLTSVWDWTILFWCSQKILLSINSEHNTFWRQCPLFVVEVYLVVQWRTFQTGEKVRLKRTDHTISRHTDITAKLTCWEKTVRFFPAHANANSSEKDTHDLVVVRPAPDSMNNRKRKLSLRQVFTKAFVYFVLKKNFCEWIGINTTFTKRQILAAFSNVPLSSTSWPSHPWFESTAPSCHTRVSDLWNTKEILKWKQERFLASGAARPFLLLGLSNDHDDDTHKAQDRLLRHAACSVNCREFFPRFTHDGRMKPHKISGFSPCIRT